MNVNENRNIKVTQEELSIWKGILINLTKQTILFEKTLKEKIEYDHSVKRLTKKISQQEIAMEEMKNNVS